MKQPGLERVMKRTAILCLCCFGLAGGAAAQSGTVKLPSLQTTLKEALRQLGRQTNYSTVINYDNLHGAMEVSVTAQVLEATELLRQILEGTGYTHKINGGLILIVPEPPVDDGTGAMPAMWRDEEPQEEVPVPTEVITFRVGSAEPDPEFMGNSQVMNKIETSLSDSTVMARLDHVSVTAASSPGGNSQANERLAMERAQSTKGYLVRRFPHLARERVHAFSVGEEWSGLRRLVADDARTPLRDEVLALIDNAPHETIGSDIRALDGGRAWRYIEARLIPKLRGSTAVALHLLVERDYIDTVLVGRAAENPRTIARVRGVETITTRPLPPPGGQKPVWAFKTNLLMDAAGAITLGIDVPIEQSWSVGAELIFPLWTMTGLTLEGRYWPGDRYSRPPLTGWFGGVYVGAGIYDLQLGSKKHNAGYYHFGLSGGYAHTINRRGDLGMEYSLGVGYLKAGRRYWFGPTRGSVSLVVMIGQK
jgi:outer membrane protein OmpA-like peptidoglycan-associated protein